MDPCILALVSLGLTRRLYFCTKCIWWHQQALKNCLLWRSVPRHSCHRSWCSYDTALRERCSLSVLPVCTRSPRHTTICVSLLNTNNFISCFHYLVSAWVKGVMRFRAHRTMSYKYTKSYVWSNSVEFFIATTPGCGTYCV